MSLLLALDQGTSSSRALLHDSDGRLLALAQKEVTSHFPQPGHVEQDADEILSTQLACAGEVLAAAGRTAAEVTALGISNQRETVVVFDRRTGRPIHRALVWQDRRTGDRCDALRATGVEAEVAARTGLLLDPYFSATKIAWILDHVPGARRAAERGELAYGTIDTWLTYALTRGARHVTDVSNAGRTSLFDLHTGRFSDAECERFDVPPGGLPELVPTSGIVERVALEGPLKDIPIAARVGDQQAALFGQRCFTPGRAKCTYGTGCFLLLQTGEEIVPSRHRLLTTPAWETNGRTQYALEGSVFVGGALIQWLRDGLGLFAQASDVEGLAARVPDSGGVTIVPAFTGLGAPHWDAHARGTITGITRGTTAAHLARAALDAIAFQVVDLVEAMELDARHPLDELRVDGGAARNRLLLQIQADLLQRPVLRPHDLESTALGASLLAGLGSGVYADTDAFPRSTLASRIEPRRTAQVAASERDRWREAVRRTRSESIA